jgi:uncharacterized protein (DUF2147 family)
MRLTHLSVIVLLGLSLLWGGHSRATIADESLAVQGLWLVEDGSAVIKFKPCGSGLCGIVYWSKDLNDTNADIELDRENPDPRLRDRTICGLPIIQGLRFERANFWGGGTVYDPDDGRTYNAEMRLDRDGRLNFRGFIAVPVLGGSQKWTRPQSAVRPCRASLADTHAASAHGLTQTQE